MRKYKAKNLYQRKLDSIKLQQIGAEIQENNEEENCTKIELKAVSFEPEFAEKLNFYVNAVNDLIRTPDENPTIGLWVIVEPKESTKVGDRIPLSTKIISSVGEHLFIHIH